MLKNHFDLVGVDQLRNDPFAKFGVIDAVANFEEPFGAIRFERHILVRNHELAPFEFDWGSIRVSGSCR